MDPGLNLGQTAEDSQMFTNIWLSSKGLSQIKKVSLQVMPKSHQSNSKLTFSGSESYRVSPATENDVSV